MKFEKPLIPGTLIKRYKRFLADVDLDDGKIVTAHTPNTGSMQGCSSPGSKVWLSQSNNPKRKYPLSWELVEVATDTIVGINTGLPNRLVMEGIDNGVIVELQGYDAIRQEVPYGKERSRIDLLLEAKSKPPCYVEVKNVTLMKDSVGFFPDAVTARGTKHLRELREMVLLGKRAVILFCIQRQDVKSFSPADDIDPVYGNTLRQVMDQGVVALAYSCRVSPLEIMFERKVPVIFQ